MAKYRDVFCIYSPAWAVCLHEGLQQFFFSFAFRAPGRAASSEGGNLLGNEKSNVPCSIPGIS